MPTWNGRCAVALIAVAFGVGACGVPEVYPDGFLPPCIANDECGATEVCVNNKCVAAPVKDMAMRPRDNAFWPPDPPPDFSVPGMGCPCVPGTKCCVDHCIPSDWCCSNNDCQAAGQTCMVDGKCHCPQGQKPCLQTCIPDVNCCTGADCPSKICHGGMCTVPDCTDGYLNGDETDLDCGGKCPACLAGRNCGRAADCRSNSCVNQQCTEPGFTKAFYGGGKHPAFLRAGDFDNDGKPDLIALDSDGTAAVGSQNLSVLKGRGDGTFIATGSYATGLGPVHAAVADLNGDMRLDVVVANAASNDVSVLLGNGDGSFLPQARYSTAGGPCWVAIGDQNRDGRPDIVVSNNTTFSFGLLLGIGDGTFKAQVQTFTWAERPRGIVLKDFNGDGFDDVAVQQVGAPPPGAVGFNSGVIGVYISKPAGGFQLPWSYATATTLLTSLFAQDLNNDGKTDLVVGSAIFTTPQIFNGTGAGTFQLAGALQNTYAGSVELFDMNGDKIVDLISGSGVHLGNGNGSFRQYVPYIGAGAAVRSLAAADYNRDGKLDIAWPDPLNNNVHALFGRGDGTLGDPRADPRVFSDTDVTLVSPRAVRVADVDGDGRGDVLMGSGPTGPMTSANLLVYLANANGTLQTPSWYAVGIGNSPSDIVVARFTRNASPDVVVANASDTDLYYLAGQGRGQLAPPKPLPVGATIASLAAADLDGDGAMDIVAATTGAEVLYLLGHNDGTFSAPQTLPVGTSPKQVVVYDWNGDKNPDILTANRGSSDISFVISRGVDGRGVLSFDAAVKVVPPGMAIKPVALGVADLNADLLPDLVVADGAAAFVRTYLNNSPRPDVITFGMPASYATAASPSAGVMADLDLDGNMDFAATNDTDRSVTVLYGMGKGTFGKTVNHDVGIGPVAIASGDINGDKRPDLVIANQGSNTITVMLGF